MIAGGKIPKDIGGGNIVRDKDGFPTGIVLAFSPSSLPLTKVLRHFRGQCDEPRAGPCIHPSAGFGLLYNRNARCVGSWFDEHP